MHEASLATSVLAVLRERPGRYDRVLVEVADVSSTPEELTERLQAYLDAADPPVHVARVEVTLRARQRLCAACATGWVSADKHPPCPACGGSALPVPHDHHLTVDLQPSGSS